MTDKDDLPTQSLGPTEAASRDKAREPRVPDNYTLLQRLGSGGMGDVWEAVQRSPVRRHVALKLIRRGLDSTQVLARFESERQALAMMDHPYIAKVYDAGETETGGPYFVMELVKGVPITRYCDRNKLSTRERLELFRKVCTAVQHAHQKAIIHRDLKPSNILVTVHEDEAIPKVIDFGVAKAVSSTLTERTLFTELGQLVGTPEYMSPEQADGGVQDVDTRSDVYSLGVVLYELLVGALPFDPKTLRSQGLDAIHKLIREVDPPKPSTRVSSLGESSSLFAEVRGTDVAHLRSDLRGDLDWITMKALEKDRIRRYETPSALAADILRYLQDEAVLASPPSVTYRARKFLRRHRLLAAAASAVAVSVLLGTLAAGWGFLSAKEAERKALEDAETARQVSEFLVEIFENADPDNTRGEDLRVREVLDTGVTRIRESLTSQPTTKAALLESMGRVYVALGQYDQARPMLEEAVTLLQEAQVEGVPVARAEGRLANVVGWQGDHEAAIDRAQSAVAVLETVGSKDEERLELASALNVLGTNLADLGRLEEAQATHERALAIREELLTEPNEKIARSLHNLAIVFHYRGDWERAAELYERAVEVERVIGGGKTPAYATSLHTLAIVRQNQGRLDEALELEERSLAIREQTLGPDHPHVSFSLMTLGQIQRDSGRYEEAEDLFRRAIEVATGAWSALYPEVRHLRRELAGVVELRGQSAEAEQLLRSLVSDTEAAGEQYESALSPSLMALAGFLKRQGDLLTAQQNLERALEIETRLSGSAHPYVLEILIPLVEIRRERGEQVDGECDRASAIQDRAEPSEIAQVLSSDLLAKLDVLCASP